MPALLADPARALAALLSAPGAPARLVVGLVGEPGAGKTTLAAQLALDVGTELGAPGTAVALSMDGFHLPRAALSAGLPPSHPDPVECHARRGAPWTFDAPALVARLRAVLGAHASAAVPWPSFDHAVGDPVEGGVSVPPGARLLLLEGLYLLHDEDGWGGVAPLLARCWYLGTPEPVARARLLARHQAAWGISLEEAEARVAQNDGLNAALVRGCRGRADAIVEPREMGGGGAA